METVNKYLTKKSLPNYIFLILSLVILILLIVVIAVASSKSSSKQEQGQDQRSDQETDQETDQGTDQEQEEEEEDISKLTPWERYKKAEKYLYIWEYYTPDYIINMCKEHHFTRVYLSIGCIETFWDTYYSQGNFPASGEIGSLDYQTFIKKLNDINVEVELVTFLGSDPNDFTCVDRVDTVANMVKQLSTKVKIKALHFDQESYENFESLLNMYIRINKIFPASAILRPYWLNLKMTSIKDQFTDQTFYEKFSDCETLVDAIMKITKYTDLMAYNQNYDIAEGYMKKLKTINSRHPDNEAKNVIEISGGAGVPEDDTMHQRYLEDKDKFFNFVYNVSKAYNGITIHYYETWYETLYCTWPRSDIPYDGGEPKNC